MSNNAVPSPLRFNLVRDYFLIFVGALIQAASVVMFLAPADLAPGGISGIAFILSRLAPIPISIGIFTLLLNVPLLALGSSQLGGWRFVARTVITVLLYSGFMSLLERVHIPVLSKDILLNTLFGAIIGGVGTGLVFRAQATTGGTDILALLLVKWRSIPLSQSYLATDALVIAMAGLVFGPDKAMYALIALYVGGLAAEAISEGVHIGRTAFIITDRPIQVGNAVLTRMQRGVTRWNAIGAYTGNERPMLFVVISRAETATLKEIVRTTDPEAFVVIGQAQEIYGEGFRQFERR